MPDFLIYKASAGAGKTTALVREFISIILGSEHPTRFAQVLAITFTNKAANEMKERVLDALLKLAKKQNDAATDRLHAHLQASLHLSSEIICQRAYKAYAAVLHQYSDLTITTIDKFVQKVIRHFTRELQLPEQYQVELEQKLIIDQALNQLFDRLADEPDLRNFLKGFLLSQLDDEKSWDLRQALTNMAEQLFIEAGAQGVEAIEDLSTSDFTKIIEQLKEWQYRQENIIEKLAQDWLLKTKQLGLHDADFFQGARGIYNFFRKASTLSYGTTPELNSYVNSFMEGQFVKAKTDIAVRQKVESIAEETSGLVIKIIELLQVPQYCWAKLLLRNIHETALLREIKREVQWIETMERRVHISQFNLRIAKIIANEPVPFIYERMGNRYRNVMIDEFQDTSVQQWSNMLPLIENGLGNGNRQMIVGDAKQAIYRWRGGEVNQFIALPNAMLPEKTVPLLINTAKTVVLDANYRSRAEVVQFNNQLYAYIALRCGGRVADVFRAGSQKFRAEHTGGFVKISWISGEEPLDEMLLRLAEDVEHCIKQHQAHYGDIAILTRTNDQAFCVADYLMQRQIPVVSSDGLALRHSSHVHALVNWLEWSMDTRSSVQLAALLHDACRRGHIEHNFQWILETKALTNALLNQYLPFSHENYWLHLNLWQRTEYFARHLGLFPTNDAFLLKFYDLVRHYAKESERSMTGFLTYWQNIGSRIQLSAPQGSQAVQIMTVHKSKGLEFPIVMLPFLGFSSKKNNGAEAWVAVEVETQPKLSQTLVKLNDKSGIESINQRYRHEREMAAVDQANTLYVATTRAEIANFLYARSPDSKPKDLHTLESFRAADERYWLMEFLANQSSGHTGVDTHTFGDKHFQLKHTHDLPPQTPLPTEASVGNKILPLATNQWPDYDNARELGLQFHAIIAREANPEKALQMLTESEKVMEFPTNFIAQWQAWLTFLKENQIYQNLIEGGYQCYAERELKNASGQWIRPDQVWVKENAAVVVDFKTGQREESHLAQITEYAHAVVAAGFNLEKAYLMYLGSTLEVVEWSKAS